MSFKDNYPITPPTLDLDFCNSTQVDPRIKFTRSSTATRVNSRGLIETTPKNQPRIDYDPTTKQCKGLLIEEQRTNLLTWSDNFSNVVWVKTNATVTANDTIAPDGTITGDTVLAVTTGGDTGVRYTTTQTSSTVYTASIYAKYTNTRYLVIRNLAIGAALGDQWTFFDLLNGTIGTKPAGVTAVITPVSGGWYRCSISATTLATIPNNLLDYRCSTSDNAYSVLNTSTINLWGAQLEAGAFPTSYIPTASASVTRAADNASMVGTNFSSWYNQSEGTVSSGYDVILNTGNRIIFDIGANDAFGTTVYSVQTSSYVGLLPGTAPVTMTSTVNTTSLVNKIATGLQNNNSIISVNGALGNLDSNCTMPSNATTLTIGCSQFGGVLNNYLNGHIQCIRYYPILLPNDQLQTLTQP